MPPSRFLRGVAAALVLSAASGVAAAAQTAAPGAVCPAVLDTTLPRLQDDAPQNLCQYAGKVILVVNTASYCGFTPQYKGLEALYREYGPQGLVVLGFPSNDFHQEMDNNAKIAAFCKDTYNVQFPMFAPSHVTEPRPNALFERLILATGTQPKWNFYKYLIARDGQVVGVYPSTTTPDNKELVGKIRALLAQKP
ncbi:glutathione peroxidase [Thiomonas sp.]|uniref:glutathione peroxidase n=1 Tax=Thiomonas sp. TaxID=2047785 RepID=UPI0026029C1F|nr:glutathione peroxidase [Thiomonas sp.]